MEDLIIINKQQLVLERFTVNSIGHLLQLIRGIPIIFIDYHLPLLVEIFIYSKGNTVDRVLELINLISDPNSNLEKEATIKLATTIWRNVLILLARASQPANIQLVVNTFRSYLDTNPDISAAIFALHYEPES